MHREDITMESIIDGLWQEYKKELTASDSDEKKKALRARVINAEDSLCDALYAAEQELFESYDACRTEEEEYKELCAFKKGVSMALKFVIEAIRM